MELKNALRFKGDTYETIGSYTFSYGSIAILCGGSVIRFNNGFGKGTFYSLYYVFNGNDAFNKFLTVKNLKISYVTTCDFQNAIILENDCFIESKLNEYKTETILNGKYDIYNCNGKIFFIKE